MQIKNKITEAFSNYVLAEDNLEELNGALKIQLIRDFRTKVLDVAFPPKKNFLQKLMNE